MHPVVRLILLLIPTAFVVAVPSVIVARRFGRRLGCLDGEGAQGHAKANVRAVPNTGGIAIFFGVALPMTVGLIVLHWAGIDFLGSYGTALQEHLPRISQQTMMAVGLLVCLLILHVMGVIDDRRPLGPWIKLCVQTGCALVMVWLFDCRLLTLLDTQPGLDAVAPWPSIVLTVLWLLVVTNAINFMDNMDGLAAGVTAIVATLFLIAACINAQWLIAAVLALLLGALLAFLMFNFPPASIFMGDGGSLVIGFLLGFLTVRTTYVPDDDPTSGWYGVFMPLVILAVPLYDFCSVVAIRLSQGRNPLVGDQQHLSHRLVQRGLSPARAVLVIWGCTLAIGLSGIGLGRLPGWQALLAGIQTIVILAVMAGYEHLLNRAVREDQP
ncbi:MAG: undecaprenyl/decaprenyl-phosphate alpha-N-acetylglucosaminyl 1-phosphate transferase [Planctomycetes bacterium]|nr:undecaprenyl/decaprenyl-phosphate alpha-N-acetylglucosaminyl 1-phosphate transferase [Planctomycetota bacterium]